MYTYKQTYLILKPLDINLNWDLQMCIAELNILFITWKHEDYKSKKKTYHFEFLSFLHKLLYTGKRISYAQRTVQRERPLFDVQYDTWEFIGLSKRFDCFTTLATKLCLPSKLKRCFNMYMINLLSHSFMELGPFCIDAIQNMFAWSGMKTLEST